MEEYTVKDILNPIECLEEARTSIISFINFNELDEMDIIYAECLIEKYDNAIRILEESNNGK